VKGFSQRPGVDYKKTFAPTVRMETVRAVVAFGAAKGFHMKLIDFRTAFLNGKLKEELYMEQPEGFGVDGDFVCRLLRCIYGLKQSAHNWIKLVTAILIELGFIQCPFDPCLFGYMNSEENIIFIALYVDDGLMIGSNLNHMDAVLASLQDEHPMTITHDVEKFLGIEITETEVCIQLHQERYIMEVLKKFNMGKCYGADIPMNPKHSLEPDTTVDRHEPALRYQELVGSLLYIARCTRPDIAFAVNNLSRYFKCYEQKHMRAAKEVLRYLSSTSHLGISYRKNVELKLVGYSDADYAGDKSGRRSTSGVLFALNDSPLSWSSRSQTLIAQSTTESEYVAMATASKEGT